MSVSDGHGGGITLQRVLGSDLNRIGMFCHVSRFARDVPPRPELLDRSLFVVSPLQEDFSRRWLRSSGARLYALPWVKSQHAERAASRMLAKLPAREHITAIVCPQGTESLLAVEALKRQRRVSYISWMMDDHIVRYDRGRWRYPGAIRDLMETHLREASTVFAISPSLAQFYREEFGIASEILFSPAERLHETATAISPAGPLTIGYFGRVFAWQFGALRAFAEALSSERERLDIYSPEPPPAQLQQPAVRYRGAVSKDRVPGLMKEYDAVLIPIGFEEEVRNLSAFNIATKMSECIASGTLTLVYGPADSAMVRYLDPTGASVILADQRLAQWPETAAALKNPDFRRRTLAAAEHLFETELSVEVMRSRWRCALQELHLRLTE